MFSDREQATVLAALRLWQRQGQSHADGEHFDEVEPLFDEDVDALCEKVNGLDSSMRLRLNTFDATGAPAGQMTAELPTAQIADIIDHAAQLVRVLQRNRQSTMDIDLICEELQEALVAANLAPAEPLPYITLRG